ncbi:hypothetical protein [Piscinibacter sp.]|uniref:hypothetical protein n=1 Tax=Piscinibacter sp. TaxID=1903157 RepID=UPI002F40FFCF
MADAGVEWAIARLNDPYVLAAAPACTTSSGSTLVSFRDRYVRPTAADGTHTSGWLNPLSTVYPGCRIDPTTGSATCACPASGEADLSASTTQPRFRVQFNTVTVAGVLDTLAVEIVSRGCTNADPCNPSVAAGSSDSSAIVRVLVKIRPTFPTIPGAGLISGSSTVTGGNLRVVNTDTASNGITINTGSTISEGSGTTVESLPGTPPRNSILDNDPSLLALTQADASGDLFFSSYFGESMDAYKYSDPLTKVITASDCASATSCGTLVSSWYDQGFTQFWVEPDVTFNGSNLPSIGTLGTADKPIAIAGAGQLELKADIVAFGMLYAATATANDNWDFFGSGGATIFGSLVSRGDFVKGAGTLNIIYNGNLFGGKGKPTGILVPVPGSWRDKSSAY